MNVKLIVNASPSEFERKVNDFLNDLNAIGGVECKVDYSVCPWACDGQAGTEFSALVTYWKVVQ
jgi:hypothetical protein